MWTCEGDKSYGGQRSAKVTKGFLCLTKEAIKLFQIRGLRWWSYVRFGKIIMAAARRVNWGARKERGKGLTMVSEGLEKQGLVPDRWLNPRHV